MLTFTGWSSPMSDARPVVRRLFEQEEPKDQSGYPEAGENAPPEIREVVNELKKEDSDVPLLYRVLGSGTPPYKMSKEESEYTSESDVEGQTCGNCRFAYKKVVSERYICSQIRGDIQPPGWCRLWTAPENSEEA